MTDSSTTLIGRDGDVRLYHRVFDSRHAEKVYQELQSGVEWRRSVIRLMGRSVPLPRLTAWYGDAEALYRYSGLHLRPLPWTPPLQGVRQVLQQRFAAQFNGVLLNYYRDGRDSVAWHSDDEPELGAQPVIASLSLGATRRFVLRHRRSRETIAIELPHNSVLLMRGPTQRHWQHTLPKTRKPIEPRINLTFRRIFV